MRLPIWILNSLILLAPLAGAQNLPLDVSGVTPGAISVESTAAAVTVEWKDEQARAWTAVFSLDPKQPLISAVAVEGRKIIERAQPFYRCETGRRRGGWDQFFDFPPGAPEGTRSFLAEFHPKSARVRSTGERVEVAFDGMKMGIFTGELRYIFYPGSRLIEQQAALAATEPDVAYYYDAGLRMASRADETAGGNMNSLVSYYDTEGKFQTIVPVYGPERKPLTVRYRAVAARMGAGSVAVFPAPHQYLFARDYTTNMGYTWHSAWRGTVSLGIRQLPDDDSPYYPWMNAPPGTVQEMRMFLVVGAGDARETLDGVLRYTHADRYRKLPGYVTFAPHWHEAYTVQARVHEPAWQPPFKAAMQAIGIDAAMIMDFHGDGHPADKTGVRFEELKDFYAACARQSGANFLLIPAEEANIYLGGHYAVVFPKQVLWQMSRANDQAFASEDAKYGTVYRTANAAELWDLVRREQGYVYQTHPRTKGSMGYPDAIRDTDYFRDARYFGVGWKAMPTDLSSPRLGERAFKTLDDLNNLGLKKRMMGEVDLFQTDTTHELYGHMNVNYVRLPALPTFEHYGQLLDAVTHGEGFISTGEVLLPEVALTGAGDTVKASVTVSYTFPLRMAELVWGDGAATHRQIVPLETGGEFGTRHFEWNLPAAGWKWARLAVWDVAGNGAFTNPVWR